MLLRLWFLMTATAACLAAATGKPALRRDFATINSALDNVNALLLQINNEINGLTPQNIASKGPELLQLGQVVVQPAIATFSQQVEASAPLSLDETNGLNTARTAFSQNLNLTVATLIQQKPLFDMVNISSQVAGILQQVHDDAASLFGVIQSKLAPSESNSAITQVFFESLDVFQMAIAVFRGQAAVAPAPSSALAPATAPPATGQGTINSDGSCACAVTCPAEMSI